MFRCSMYTNILITFTAVQIFPNIITNIRFFYFLCRCPIIFCFIGTFRLKYLGNAIIYVWCMFLFIFDFFCINILLKQCSSSIFSRKVRINGIMREWIKQFDRRSRNNSHYLLIRNSFVYEEKCISGHWKEELLFENNCLFITMCFMSCLQWFIHGFFAANWTIEGLYDFCVLNELIAKR